MRDRNRLKEAQEAYQTALRLDDRDGRTYYDLGLVLAETHRPTEAETAFRRAAALEPKDVDILRTLARQLERNKKAAEAQKVLEHIVKH